MRQLLASALVAGACAMVIGMEAAVTSALHVPPGGVATVITLGGVLLGLWAIAVLREA